MTVRLLSRILVVLALVAPMTVTAADAQQSAHPVATKLLITVEPPGGKEPAILRHVHKVQTFDAQSRSMRLSYTATGLNVEMTNGSYTVTAGDKSRKDSFQTMYLVFATNGDMTSVRVE